MSDCEKIFIFSKQKTHFDSGQINMVDYLDSPDTLMNSSALSLPALYSQLQQSTSTSSPQKPNVTRPIDPYQSNYIRMERKFKTAMRKVKNAPSKFEKKTKININFEYSFCFTTV